MSSRRKSTESNSDTGNKSQSRRQRNTRLHEQNIHYRRNYRPFIIPTAFYNIVYVHQFTSMDIISTLIIHFESCYRYSLDTETDRFTKYLSLIQVHSIPQCLPSFVVLFEINHFPPIDSLLMGKIKLLFTLIFRLGNIIFSWGSMSGELESAVQMNLFTWPVLALLFDLQEKFFSWYCWALPSCKVCGSIQLPDMVLSSKSRCICTSYFPYDKSTDKWSLQNAICYCINRFLDKSSTLKNWSVILDAEFSPLSSTERQKRLNYCIYDCFAVTVLHRAIHEYWTLTQLRTAELTTLFTSHAPPHLPSSNLLENNFIDEKEKKSTSLTASNVQKYSTSFGIQFLLEDVSADESNDDDEIFVSALSSQPRTHTTIDIIRHDEIRPVTPTNDDIIEPNSSNQQTSSLEPPLPRRSCRSSTARTRRNRKRNGVRRLYRDRHIIYRQTYYRFNHRQIKHILRDRGVQHVHIKLDENTHIVSIGMKNPSLVDLYFDRLPGDLFDKKHYQQYRRH